jgi:chitin synthase
VAINFVVVVSLCLWKAFRWVRPEKKNPPPEEAETLMLIIPCYNENEDELRRSLDSLIEQKGIDEHKQALFIIVDGRARGPGMSETTGDCLLNTILTEKTTSCRINNAYMAWDKEPMDIMFQKGTYRGMPYVCIVKMTNKGKRDSLILLRSFGMFSNKPFWLTEWAKLMNRSVQVQPSSRAPDYNPLSTPFRRNVLVHIG